MNHLPLATRNGLRQFWQLSAICIREIRTDPVQLEQAGRKQQKHIAKFSDGAGDVHPGSAGDRA